MLAMISLGCSEDCSAQRGGSFHRQAEPWQAPSQGFPGYFDSNVARKNSLVVEFPPLIYGILPTPFLSVDYGVTDTLTVGTNAIFTTVPWLINGTGGSIKVRSLLYGTDTQQSSVTYYGGGLTSYSDTRIEAYYHAMTTNHAWKLGRHLIFAHANYLRMNLELGRSSDIDHAEIGLTTFLLGAGYGYDISSRIGLRLHTISSVYQSLEAETAGAALTQSSSLKKPKSATLFGMAQVEYHTATDWLVCAGFSGLNIGGTGVSVPWVSAGTRW